MESFKVIWNKKYTALWYFTYKAVYIFYSQRFWLRVWLRFIDFECYSMTI